MHIFFKTRQTIVKLNLSELFFNEWGGVPGSRPPFTESKTFTMVKPTLILCKPMT